MQADDRQDVMMAENRTSTPASARGGTALRDLFLPVGMILLISVAAIVALLVVAAQRADREARDNSLQLAGSAAGHLEKGLASVAKELGWWDDAVANLLPAPNLRWVEHYLTGYVLPTYDVSGLLVFDENDRLLLSLARGGGALEGFAEASLLTDLSPLFGRTRASPMDIPEPATGYLTDASGGVWLAAASVIARETPSAEQMSRQPRPVVVVLQALDAARLEPIAESYLLPELRVATADSGPEEPFLALAAPGGATAAYLAWQPHRPGAALLLHTLPATAGAFLLIGAFFLVFLRRMQRAQAQVDQREALAELNRRLEDEMAGRRGVEADLRAALEREKELGRLKSRFVAMASHEFRTPLTTIAAASDLLLHYDKRMSTADKVKNLGEIQAEVRNMTDLLEDILLIGQGEADRIRFKPVPIDLEPFCTELVEKTESLNKFSHPIRFTPARKLGTVMADDKLLRHIMVNLLSNAFKYSPSGTPVSVKLSRGDGVIELRVRDRGVGIPEVDLEHIFEAFHRAENASDIQGTGLGLTIAKKAVDLHGGTITVESVEGEGTTFTVTIPDRPVDLESDDPSTAAS
jgi:signal transduction histidine kinase